MIAAQIFALLLCSSRTERTVELPASASCWVYPHASDPTADPFIRVWGAEGMSVAPNPGEAGEFSYGYLQFDVKDLKAGKLKSAKLVLTHVANPTYPLDYVKTNPLEVRSLIGDFVEKDWAYEKVTNITPDKAKEALLGKGVLEALPEKDKEAVWEVDLLAVGSFQDLLSNSSKSTSGKLTLALCSSVDPSAMGTKGVYKFHSKSSPEASKRPKLRLVFED